MLRVVDVALAQWAEVRKVPTGVAGETVNVFVGRTLARGPRAAAGKGQVPVSAVRLGA